MDLFTQNTLNEGPLAYKLRPQTLEDYYGQDKIIGPGSHLKSWIDRDALPSLILWGPPGCGKTTLAHIIAEKSKSHFESLSAVLSGVKDIKEVVEKAMAHRALRKTILFIDEIHRFNKSQQDALLPHVENGTVIFIGATTENPSFEINSALLSRCKVIPLESLSVDAVKKILSRALQINDNKVKLEEDALELLARFSEGDARKALGTLESILQITSDGKTLSSADVKIFLEKSAVKTYAYDKKGEQHYNIISAFIKSLRDSDPHAAIYYLARMLEAGEDPRFIVRRLFIFASEDIGNADPQAMLLAEACKEAVLFIGMPEARINLAQLTTYLALAPKSNAAYMALENAIAEVRQSGSLNIPLHLRNAPSKLMKEMNYGKDYEYSHDLKKGHSNRGHLPNELQGKKFYIPKDSGLEKHFASKLESMGSRFGDEP